MAGLLSSETDVEGVDELSVVVAMAFCQSIHWLELAQTMSLAFANGRRVDFFVGDKPMLLRLIEQAATVRHLPINHD